MRNKIIAVNAVIVLIVGLLSYVIVRSALLAAADNPTALGERAKFDVQGAAARLQLDGLRSERWLAAKASEPATLDPLTKATQSARGESATALCDALLSTARQSPMFERAAPSLVALVDPSGKIVGRNGATLNRGDDLGALYPQLKDAISKGQSGSDVWARKDRSDLYMASYAAVRDENGKIVGGLVLGVPLNDELTRTSEIATGRPLLLASLGADLDFVAHSSSADAAAQTVSSAKDAIKSGLTAGHAVAVPQGDVLIAAAPLEGFGDGRHSAVVAALPATLIDNVAAMPLPIFGVTALGLILVVIGGWLLGNYISRPINQLEEGLLAILNGQHDKRFELDHAELGGLGFRIDQLLNQLMGVEEDNTDDEGRVSKAPEVGNFNAAMAVDERRGQAGADEALDPGALQRLASEPEADYYARIYREYIQAKKAIGEQTDHISAEAFATRIQGMEREATAKHGRPVRYRVQKNDREVVLLAIPL